MGAPLALALALALALTLLVATAVAVAVGACWDVVVGMRVGAAVVVGTARHWGGTSKTEGLSMPTVTSVYVWSVKVNPNIGT